MGRHEGDLREAGMAAVRATVTTVVPGGAVLAEALNFASSRRETAFWYEFVERIDRLEDVIDRLRDEHEHLMLVARGAEQARRAIRAEQAQAMGHVVAATLEDPESPNRLTLDRATVLLRLLDDLQALHIAILAALDRPYPARHPGFPPGTTMKGNLDVDSITRSVGEDGETVGWVLNDLARRQLISFSDRSDDGFSRVPGPARADLLPIGRELLRYTTEAKAE